MSVARRLRAWYAVLTGGLLIVIGGALSLVSDLEGPARLGTLVMVVIGIVLATAAICTIRILRREAR